jgi:hypothetical protein
VYANVLSKQAAQVESGSLSCTAAELAADCQSLKMNNHNKGDEIGVLIKPLAQAAHGNSAAH